MACTRSQVRHRHGRLAAIAAIDKNRRFVTHAVNAVWFESTESSLHNQPFVLWFLDASRVSSRALQLVAEQAA